jgi:A/G-specific adenine glycosylase
MSLKIAPKRNRLHPLPAFDRKKLSHSLLSWFREDRRSLPWRKTGDPYRILVSEIMLQQTQVSRVAPKYVEFMRRFPTVTALARARAGDVIRVWSGLGYNVRALRLRRVAQLLIDRYDGKVPSDPSALIKLPGVGKYTANAIAVFAFNRDVPVVDTNIHRVLSRVYSKMRSPDGRIPEPKVWEIAERVFPRGHSRVWTLALMDLGAIVCTADRPACSICPVKRVCRSAFALYEERRRRKTVRREPSHDGIPNRIYRGKVVEALRRVNGSGSIELRDLGYSIKTTFRRSEERWLRSILDGLQRDGLVRMTVRRSGKVNVSLP